MWNVAQCGSHFTDETIANSAFNYNVQPDAILCVHTPFVHEFKHKAVLLGSNAAICCTVLAAQPNKVAHAPKTPE